MECSQLLTKIEDIDQLIANECSEENMKKVTDNFGMLSSGQDSLNTKGMWAVKKKVFPKNTKPLPLPKYDFNVQIITNPDALKELYLETYKLRLRHRPIKPEMANLKVLKETLFALRIKLAKLTKSEQWSESDLKKVLNCLKKNKSRDPHGLITELFKPEVIGSDLKSSLLTLFNENKSKCHIPECIQGANIVESI